MPYNTYMECRVHNSAWFVLNVQTVTSLQTETTDLTFVCRTIIIIIIIVFVKMEMIVSISKWKSKIVVHMCVLTRTCSTTNA